MKKCGSIDGSSIVKNEFKKSEELPFIEENLDELNIKVLLLFNKTKIILKKIEYYSKLYPNDSLIIEKIDSYTTIYENCCHYDRQNIDSLKMAINGFNTVIDGMSSVLEQIKYKFSDFDKQDTTQKEDQIISQIEQGILDVNGESISSQKIINNNSKSMGFSGMQLFGLVSFVSSVIIATIGLLFWIIMK